ncbi:MAG TPA: hypothetical protein VEQ10_15610 [Vicinamibacteria bacterium]|nr:hypothetical protein [Vicinamibacteria bacterium]
MREEAKRADRHREVRTAARAWRRAGAIDQATLAAIEAAYPDDRARLGPVFRTLAFVFGVLALDAFFGVIALATHGRYEFGVACLFFAVALVAATEVLTGPLKRADSGIETATALLSVVWALVGMGVLLESTLDSERELLPLLLGAGALLAGAGSVRWGSPVLAAVASASIFLLLGQSPGGRALWVLVALLAVPLLIRGGESAAFPPSHRRSLQVGLVLAITALYLATNLVSWDRHWLESLAVPGASPAPGPALRPLAVVLTALVPLLVLAFAVATCRVLLVDVGVLLGVASLVTLRAYVHLVPVWAVLAGSGAAALVAVLGLRRWLASGAGGERGGFTAEPLFEDAGRRRSAEMVGALVTLGPQPAARPAEAPGMRPGGGQYGGGGATGEF